MKTSEHTIALEHLEALPFLQEARVQPTSKGSLLQLSTTKGRFTFPLEVRRSYLTQTGTNALVVQAGRLHEKPFMLFARYVSRPVGERLAKAGINFVDDAGNLHIHLGDRFQSLILGRPEKRLEPENKRLGAATVQVLFTHLVDPKTVSQPVRGLAALAGVGKTAASDARARLLREGLIQDSGQRRLRLSDTQKLEELFLEGYQRLLRPPLFFGRFRSQHRDPDQWLQTIPQAAQRRLFRWALTGSAGAWELDHFYKAAEICLYVDGFSREILRELALLPDRQGPITLLRVFSPLVVWREDTRYPIAHPWLIFAELLHSDDPRAVEAAAEIRARHLHEPSDA